MAAYELVNLNLQSAISQIERGQIQLPEFQRDFKWKQAEQRSLLESIQKDYPAGSLLLLEIDAVAGPPFAVRPFEGVGTQTLESPRLLVLDGQQRLTTCFKAFSGNSKKWTVIDLKQLFDDFKTAAEPKDLNFEEYIRFEAKPRVHEDEILLSRDYLPFSFIRDRAQFRQRLASYRNSLLKNPSTQDFGNFVDVDLEGMLDVFFEYQFPSVRLPASLDLEAVANVFTKINTTGMRLSAFDLCVAALFPKNISLRTMWNEVQERPEIAAFQDDGTSLIQSIALSVGVNSRKASLFKTINESHINAKWNPTVEAMKTAAHFLTSIGIPSTKTLPYDVALPMLTAVTTNLPPAQTPPDQQTRSSRTARFVLHTAFSMRYTEGVDVKRESDYPHLVEYFASNTTPEFLNEVIPWDRDLVVKISNSGARFKAFLALLNKNRPNDLINTAQAVGLDMPATTQAEIHHVFPRKFLETIGRGGDADRAFNMTFLTRESNNYISDRAPSIYLNEILAEKQSHGLSAQQAQDALLEELKSHFLDKNCLDALLQDDYDAFLLSRSDCVRNTLANVFGIPISLIDDHSEDLLEEGEVFE